MRIAIPIALIFATSVAHADHNEVLLGGGTRALRSSSADAVTADSLGIGGVGYARELGLEPVSHLALWAESRFDWGTVDGNMFQTMSTHVASGSLVVGGGARYALHRLVGATARVDLGTARTSLSLNDGSGHTASDSGWGAVVQGALGVEVFLERSQVFGFGLRAELGYTATSGVALTPHADSSSDTLKLQMTDASIGHLDLSGPSFALAMVGQF
jgi:hypothetical protein